MVTVLLNDAQNKRRKMRNVVLIPPFLRDRKRKVKQPNYQRPPRLPSHRLGVIPTSHSELRMRTTHSSTCCYRPRKSPITIPYKNPNKTIRCPIVICNRRRSRHTKRLNNRILFVRAAKSRQGLLAGCIVLTAGS